MSKTKFNLTVVVANGLDRQAERLVRAILDALPYPEQTSDWSCEYFTDGDPTDPFVSFTWRGQRFRVHRLPDTGEFHVEESKDDFWILGSNVTTLLRELISLKARAPREEPATDDQDIADIPDDIIEKKPDLPGDTDGQDPSEAVAIPKSVRFNRVFEENLKLKSEVGELKKKNNRLHNELCLFYRADGAAAILRTPEQVIAARKAAAVELGSLKQISKNQLKVIHCLRKENEDLRSRLVEALDAEAGEPEAAEPERWRFAAHGVEHGPHGKRYTVTVEFEDGQRTMYEVDGATYFGHSASVDQQAGEISGRWRDGPLPVFLDPKRRIETREELDLDREDIE